MRTIVATISFTCVLAMPPTFGQSDGLCGTSLPFSSIIQNRPALQSSQSATSAPSSVETNGIYLPAKGELRILVVFARLKDDNSPHFDWPINSDPNAYTNWIDTTMQVGSSTRENFTNYYRQMSIGSLKVTGRAVSVETPHNMSYYSSFGGAARFQATKEVIQDRVDPLVDFATFDNWRFDYDFHHTNVSDGSIDMIVMIWRGMLWADWGGEASLGYGGSFSVENGTKTVSTSYRAWAQPGSGVTIQYFDNGRRDYSFHSAIHEIAHWLVGAPHPYSNVYFAYWGMLRPSFADGVCANTYERERLGWITPSPALEWAALQDFISTGVAYKYHPPGGQPNEWYYFENHQKISVYDDATTNPGDKGVWIIHQQSDYNGTDNSKVMDQDGTWNWTNPSYNTTCFPPHVVGVFKKNTVNRTMFGKSIRGTLLATSGYQYPHSIQTQSGSILCGGFFRGDAPFRGAYNSATNTVFSTWSNPRAATWSDVPVDFAMEVIGEAGSTVNVWFHTESDAISASPSKPQNLRIVNTTYTPIQLQWESNVEPDISMYDVWRMDVYQGDGWRHIASTTTASYTDQDYIWLPSGNGHLFYKIRAKDTQGLLSSFSDQAYTEGEPTYEIRNDSSSARAVLSDEARSLDLVSNFPNPFNPDTHVSYTIPRNGHVLIKVYDPLGRIVETLVDRMESVGHHEVLFRAHGLSSGAYFLQASFEGRSMTRRLLLAR